MFDGLGIQLASHTATHFNNGKYLVWRIAGHVRFELFPHCPSGDPNCNAFRLMVFLVDALPAIPGIRVPSGH